VWHNIFVPELSIAEKVIRPVLVYLFLVVVIRLAGRRQLAQLNSFDLVVLMMLANTVQNATIGNDNSMVGGLIGVSALLLVNALVVRFLYRRPQIDRLLEGEPVTLIKNGELVRDNLNHEAITEEELMEAVRKQGLGTLGQVEEAVLETGGVISVVPRTTIDDRIHHLDGRLNAIDARLGDILRQLRLQDAQPQ